MEEHRLRVFENRVPRKIFGSKRNEVTGEWRKLHNEEFMICIPRQILFGWSNREERGGRDMKHVWGFIPPMYNQ